MNFLAHSLLTPCQDQWMVGNMIADLIKKKDSLLLDYRIQSGVQLHYKIDTFTDQHPLIKEATLLLHKTQGKYAPVATDLIWDLCLASQWKEYTTVELNIHIENIYKGLELAMSAFEEKLEQKLRYLISKNFLASYTTPSSMQMICEKIHTRTRFNSNLTTLMEDYKANQVKFNSLFKSYFPLLLGQIESWKQEITNNINSDYTKK